MGLQIPLGICAKISKEEVVRRNTPLFGPSISRISEAERIHDFRGPYGVRSCAYADSNSTEVFGIADSGIYQKKKCDSSSASIQ